MVGIGLNWWQSIITIFISQLISSIAMLFVIPTGRPLVKTLLTFLFKFQLTFRERVSHRIPSRWTSSLWHVWLVLLRWRSRCSRDHLGRIPISLTQTKQLLTAASQFGVQLYSGSALLANVLRAVFGHNYTDIPNKIPASMGITSAGMY